MSNQIIQLFQINKICINLSLQLKSFLTGSGGGFGSGGGGGFGGRGGFGGGVGGVAGVAGRFVGGGFGSIGGIRGYNGGYNRHGTYPKTFKNRNY